MFNPKNIEDPPVRERMTVEHTTKHTIVLKPGFQNRRSKSEYLKNSFPAGFLVKNKLTEKLGESILKDNLSGRQVNPYGSFTEWTKGQEPDPVDNVSIDLTDPYADVAGPYLSDMLRARSTVQKPLPAYADEFNNVIAREIPLHNRSERNSKPKRSTRNSPTKPQVFNAPALMPGLTPALVANKINNNLLPVNPSTYDQWLSTQRSGNAEKAWLVKGNAEGYNYSAYEFGGDKSPSLTLSTTGAGYDDGSIGSLYSPTGSQAIPPIQTGSHAQRQQEQQLSHAQAQLLLASSYSTLLTELPVPLPPRILLEVHTVNQMIRTDKLCEDKHIMRSVESQVSLAELKCLITEDIIQGIETAFRLYSDDTPPSQRHGHMDYSKVELHFQCFLPLAGSWRTIANETDWTLVKQNCRNEQNVIKLMYALEKNSEFLLLQEIQQSYQRQRDKLHMRVMPQVSLQALTESMEQSLRLKKKYVYSDSLPNSNMNTARTSAPLPRPKPTNFLPQARSVVMPPRAGKLSRGGSQSIHHLLESLNNTDPFRREHRPSLMSDSGSVNAHSLMGGSAAQSVSGPSTASTTGGAVLNTSRSFFYPKRSDTLDKMYEELESSMPRQQSFANNLEQRLFKTKW